MPGKLSGLLGGYRRKVLHEYSMWRHRRRAENQRRYYERWIQRMSRRPPEVFVGPDLAYGGVRGHVRAIRKFSGLRVGLVPDEEALRGLGNFTADLRAEFAKFPAPRGSCVHSHVLPWFIRWCRLQQAAGRRWVHTYHNMYFPEFAIGGLLDWQREVNDALIHEACHADVRISVSKWQQKYLEEEHGIQTGYVPNGVDVPSCECADAARFRRSYGIMGKFVLFVGRNDPVKNPADFCRLAASAPEREFVAIGDGLSVQTMRDEWALECPVNLRLIDGVKHREVQDALAAAEVLAVTSKREGLPTLVLEAMVQGTPVVVPDEAGCLEAAGDGEFGYIYPAGDIGAMRECVDVAARERGKCAAARRRVLSEYDWRAVAPKLDAIYRGGNGA